jgi:hypothetical protein
MPRTGNKTLGVGVAVRGRGVIVGVGVDMEVTGDGVDEGSAVAGVHEDANDDSSKVVRKNEDSLFIFFLSKISDAINSRLRGESPLCRYRRCR